MDVIRYTLSEKFRNTDVDQIAPTLIPYVSVQGRVSPVPVDKTHGFDRSTLTVGELLEMAVKIPFVYGRGLGHENI